MAVAVAALLGPPDCGLGLMRVRWWCDHWSLIGGLGRFSCSSKLENVQEL